MVALVFALSVLGIFVVGSAKESLQNRQIFGVIIGLSVMAAVSLFDYIWILEFNWIIYLVAIGSLGSVLLIGQTEVDQPWFYDFSAV